MCDRNNLPLNHCILITVINVVFLKLGILCYVNYVSENKLKLYNTNQLVYQLVCYTSVLILVTKLS